jgi:hypothetical protein
MISFNVVSQIEGEREEWKDGRGTKPDPVPTSKMSVGCGLRGTITLQAKVDRKIYYKLFR